METVALESDGKQVERSRNGTKRLKIVQKAFSHFFVNGISKSSRPQRVRGRATPGFYLCPSALGSQKWVWASARKKRLAASGKPNALLALPKGRKSPPGYYADSILEFLPERH